jgi:hypothetical protein
MSAVIVRRPISNHVRWSPYVLVALMLSLVSFVSVAHAATAPPSAPTLLSPATGASMTNPATLTWGASTGAAPIVAYQWQVSSNSTFTAIKAWGNPMATGSIPPPLTDKVSGLVNGTYFWRVQATQDQVDPIEGLVTGRGVRPGRSPSPARQRACYRPR